MYPLYEVTYPTCLSPSYTRKGGSKINGNEQLPIRGAVVFNLETGQIIRDLLHVVLKIWSQGVDEVAVSSTGSFILFLSMMSEGQEDVRMVVQHIRL